MVRRVADRDDFAWTGYKYNIHSKFNWRKTIAFICSSCFYNSVCVVALTSDFLVSTYPRWPRPALTLCWDWRWCPRCGGCAASPPAWTARQPSVHSCRGAGGMVATANTMRCGGSLVAHQTSEAEVPGSYPASLTMILMLCRIIGK